MKHLHYECDCMPGTGEPHCHGCHRTIGRPVPWRLRRCVTERDAGPLFHQPHVSIRRHGERPDRWVIVTTERVMLVTECIAYVDMLQNAGRVTIKVELPPDFDISEIAHFKL